MSAPSVPPSSPAPAHLVTLGETMVLFHPLQGGALAYAPLLTRSVAGAESNVCIALTRLGKRTRWISRLGADPFGDLIMTTLRGEGVDVSFITRDPSAPTGIFFREFKSSGDPIAHYYRAGSAASKLKPEDVRADWFQDAGHFHVTGITPALGIDTTEATILAMKIAREAGLTISFDPNLRRKLWDEDRARRTLLKMIPLCDLFLPGIEEAEFLLGIGTPEEYGKAFLDMGAQLVVLKCGAEGSIGFAGGHAIRIPPYPVSRVVDTIGAGDAFAAGFLSVLLDHPGWSQETSQPSPDVLKFALTRANLMGALATQFPGDWEGLPTLAELENLQHNRQIVTR